MKLSRGIVGADLYCFVPGFDKFLSHLACRKVSIVFSHTVLGGWVDGWGLGHSVLLRELGMDVGGIQCGSVMAHLDCPFDWNMEHLRD